MKGGNHIAQEVQESTYALSIKAAKLTAETFLKAIKGTLNSLGNELSGDKPHYGKQSLNSLLKHGEKLQNIEVSDKNIRSFQSSARKHHVDFAVKKIPDENQSTYIVFFKSKDIDQVNRAFKDYVNKQTHRRPSVIQQIRQEQREQQAQSREHRTQERTKERGMER
ncbi:MAG: PcfB family protein [Eubacterium sp.]|nr:PcfB family protein [Eubacterium sp.]